jgi:hypothetical protein
METHHVSVLEGGVWSVERTNSEPCNRVMVTHLFENNLLEEPPVISCEGEPAPDRVLPAILLDEFKPPGRPKGDLSDDPGDGSMGDVLAAVGEVERVWEADCGE